MFCIEEADVGVWDSASTASGLQKHVALLLWALLLYHNTWGKKWPFHWIVLFTWAITVASIGLWIMAFKLKINTLPHTLFYNIYVCLCHSMHLMFFLLPILKLLCPNMRLFLMCRSQSCKWPHRKACDCFTKLMHFLGDGKELKDMLKFFCSGLH